MNTENLNTQELETLRTLLNKMAGEPKTAKVNQTEVMIANIIREFDFLKVQAVMEALNWGWGITNNQVPTTLELRETAIGLLRDAAKCRLGDFKDEHWEIPIVCGTGGFEATAYCDEDKTKIIGLNLQFVAAEWSVDLDDLNRQ
jgi:hypothetical protein